MTYGERLAMARICAGLTQKELAGLVGMRQPSLAHLEKQGKGSAFTVKFSRACGVSPDWLDDEIGEMRPPDANAEATKTPEDAAVVDFRWVYHNAPEAGRNMLLATLYAVNDNMLAADKRLPTTKRAQA